MAMNVSTSWTGIPRDYREQERLRLEHELFRNISFENSGSELNLEYDDDAPAVAQGGHDEFSEQGDDSYAVEFPRNPQMLSHDFTAPDISLRYPAGTLTDHEEGETRSTIAHHAHAVTFRTGLRGRAGTRTRAGSPSVEYDPDRHLDALVKGTSDFSILADSPDHGHRSTSRSRSEFTKRAQGLSKQIEHEKSRRAPLTTSMINTREPNHIHEAATQPQPTSSKFTAPTKPKVVESRLPEPAPFKHPNPYSYGTVPPPTRTPTRVWPAYSKIQLPDVTGITTAVATPLKGEASFKRFPTAKFPPSTLSAPAPRQASTSKPETITTKTGRADEADTVTAAALDNLTKKLRDIEKENATSRRRVTELELDLENCKEEVKREKTRLHDLSRTMGAQGQRSAVNGSRGQRNYGLDMSLEEGEKRYKMAVEEKKALEDLVQSLQAHLASMSVKVQSNQDAISQLRNTREQDALQLREKCQEIEFLRKDVEGLQSDVERLRDVVEAGLRERKTSRGDNENSIIVGERTEILDAVQDAEEEEEGYSNPLLRPLRREPDVLSAVLEEDEPSSTRDGRRSSARSNSRRFIKDSEIERVRLEIEERRSQRSMNASLSNSGSEKSHHRSRSYAQGFNAAIRPASPVVVGNRREQHTPPRPDSRAASEGEMSVEREGRYDHQYQRREERVPSPTALPQIRGERLERLFRAAPEHDERTCGVCHRRKRSSSGTTSNPGAKDAGKRRVSGEEMFGSGDERYISEIAARRGLPPQTVLARVLRELEDDFTHYKSIYIELADQYKAMDAASDASKRRLLANHLREVIDVLEQKGDQIASLYDLLHFEDKPLPSSSNPSRPGPSKLGPRR